MSGIQFKVKPLIKALLIFQTWEYDWVQREWSKMAPLYQGRHSHACALAHNGQMIVVAGGMSVPDQIEGTTTAEMLDLMTGMWHKMPLLPHAIAGALFAKLEPGSPHGSGPFAFIGGSFQNNQILQFVRRGKFETGNEATQRVLSQARRFPAVIVASPRLICLR